MKDTRPTSYSFQHRGELPSYDGAFTRDAGLSRAAFEELRTRQPVPLELLRDHGERDAWHVKINCFELPQPHPDFAPPNRARFNADWEEKRQLARAAFLEKRSGMAFKPSRIRKR